MKSTKFCSIIGSLNCFRTLIVFPFLLFFCSSKTLSQTSLVYPNNNWVQIDDSLSFIWNECDGADSYEISFSNTVQFTVEDVFNVIGNNYEDSFSQGKYFWRVRCINGGIPSSWSNTRSFSITNVNNFGDIAFWVAADSNVVKDVNDKVSEWNDVGVNSIDFTQPTLSPQPLWEDSIEKLNNFPAMYFDGVDDFLEANVANLNIAELFVVANWTNGQSTFPSYNGLIMPNNGLLFYVGAANTTNFYINASTAFNGNNFINRQPTTDFGPISKFKLVHGRRSNPESYVGTEFRIGRDRNLANRFWNGYIPEIIAFSTPLSLANLDSVHQYLKFKYSPPVNLGLDILNYSYCDITLSSGVRFESYLWSTGDTTETITTNVSGTYWVEVVDIFGFTSTDTVEVIFPEPDIPDNQLFCPGNQKTWHTNLGPNYDYLWSDGSTADSLSINTPGDYYVQITDTNGCVFQSDTLYFDEDSFETIVDFGPDVNLCSGNSIGLVAGDTQAIDYLWSTGETDSTIIVNSTGTYYLDVVNDNGCEASDTINVTIIGDAPTVVPGISSTVCQNETLTYQDQSTTSDGSTIVSWSWDFGDGGTSTNEQGSYSYTNNGAFNLSLTVETSAGCFNDTSISINVNEQPVLDFITVNDCQESVINFNGGQLTPTTINTWEWYFDDPGSGIDNEGSGQNTTHIFDTSGVYFVELIGTDINGCKDTIVQAVTIEAAPLVDFSFDEVCEGSLIEFDNLTTINPSNTISSYTWSFGDGTFSGQTEPQKLYSSYGTFSVTLSATGNNGCSDQLTQPLKVHAFPIVDQNIISSCAGITTVFNDASFVPSGSVAEVYWSLNGASTINGFSIEEIFENSGSQTVDQTVVSGFGCTSNENYTIQVNDFIQADFEIDPNALLGGYTTSFINLSVGVQSNEWIFGDLGTSNDVNPEFIFPESEIGNEVTIELKVENSFACRDSVSLTLPVLSPRTDLATSQLFVQEDNGFYIVGVELENLGTTPINSADLFLRTPATNVVKETWVGELKGGEKEIYVFSASPSMTVPQAQVDQNYVCVEAQIKAPSQFADVDMSNNDICEAISQSTGVLIIPHPNPVENDLNIKVVLPFDEIGTLKVYNAQGQIVASLMDEESFSKGLNSFELNTELWQSGNYSIVYKGESAQQIAKVIKL